MILVSESRLVDFQFVRLYLIDILECYANAKIGKCLTFNVLHIPCRHILNSFRHIPTATVLFFVLNVYCDSSEILIYHYSLIHGHTYILDLWLYSVHEF